MRTKHNLWSFGCAVAGLVLLTALGTWRGDVIAQQPYEVSILSRPAGFSYAYGEGIASAAPVGFGIPTGGDFPVDIRALRWTDPQTAIDITPSGFHAARIEDGEDDQFVGSASSNPGAYAPRAFLWLNGGSTTVNLHPPGYNLSEALGAGGGRQAGYVLRSFYCSECGRQITEHASLWSGSVSTLALLHAPGFDAAHAQDSDGTQHVGWGFRNTDNGPPYHALLWSGTDTDPVDLHPSGDFDYSFAVAVADGEQAGYGWGPATDGRAHALLWHHTAQSVVDLNPAGFFTSEVTAVRGGMQVGSGGRAGDYHNRALVWRGTRESVIDLHELLPPGYRLGDSLAKDIDVNGDIVGIATEDATSQTVAVRWRFTGSVSTATKLTVANLSGRPGKTVMLTARLTRVDDDTAVAGKVIQFTVNGTSKGFATTNHSGVATRSYRIPRTARAGTRSLVDVFAGDAGFAASTGSGTLTVVR
jgi:hypothetical protein